MEYVGFGRKSKVLNEAKIQDLIAAPGGEAEIDPNQGFAE